MRHDFFAAVASYAASDNASYLNSKNHRSFVQCLEGRGADLRVQEPRPRRAEPRKSDQWEGPHNWHVRMNAFTTGMFETMPL